METAGLSEFYSITDYMIRAKYELRTRDCSFITKNAVAVNTGLSFVVLISEATGLTAFPVGRDKTVFCAACTDGRHFRKGETVERNE
jgi:hypothetical protein